MTIGTIQSSPALQNFYESLLRSVGHEHLIATGEDPDFEAYIRALLAEARDSERRDDSGLGWLAGFEEEELMQVMRLQLAGRRGLAFPLQLVSDEVLAAAHVRGYTADFPVHVGVYPTGTLNAQVARTDAGAVLLINSGLMMFLHQVAGLLLQSAQVIVLDGDAGQTQASVPALLTHDKVVDQLTELVLAYLLEGNSTSGSIASVETGVQGILATLLAKGADAFVVGHELGHVCAGHLSAPRTVRCATAAPGHELTVVLKGWYQEIEADILGLELLLPPPGHRMQTRADVQLVEYRIAGAFLFLELDALLSAMREQLHGTSAESLIDHKHPPPSARIECLTEVLKHRGGEGLLGFARFVQQWFARLRPQVSAAAADRLRADAVKLPAPDPEAGEPSA